MIRSAEAWHTVAFTVLLLAAAAVRVDAGSIESARPFRRQGWLHVTLQARDLLDARTVSTVESGLPGSCVYRIHLQDRQGEDVGQRLVELSVRLDLWENRYRLQGPQGSLDLSTLAAADSALSHLEAVRLLPLERLSDAQEYRLQVDVIVQPLAAHDQARISRYVSQNTRGPRQEFALNLSALFNRVFGQRGAAEDSGSPFRSAYFKPRELEESP